MNAQNATPSTYYKDNSIMNRTYYKTIIDLKNSLSKCLLLGAGVNDNTATTELLAVKPDRHTLAIFVPKICEPTKPTFTTGAKARHTFKQPQFEEVASYDGLKGGNTRAFMVNTPCRLVTVVESRHPFIMGDIQTTKLLGGYHA